MIKQLRKVGNSQALILDKPILELQGIKNNSAVQLTVSNGSLVVTPIQANSASDEEFRTSLAKVLIQRRKFLARLSQ